MLFFAFSFAAFNNFSLCLIFIGLFNICLGVFLFVFIFYGTLWDSWTRVAISFPMLGKFLTIISSNIFLYILFFSSGTPVIWVFFFCCCCCYCYYPGGFWDCPQLFSLIFPYFPPQQLFPSLHLPAYLSILLPQLLKWRFHFHFIF